MPSFPWRRSLAACVLAAVALPAAAQLYRDPRAPLDKRVDDLVSRMTLEEKAAQMQNAAPAIPRLGVPPYDYWNEALHGVARAGEATIFPQAIAMAATWDEDLLREEGRVVAIEGRARYNQAQKYRNYDRYFGLTFWSPNINIFRDPRWGRGQETLGEDPYLTGLLGTRFVQGVQGSDPKYYAAIATPKHFAVHSGPEPSRHRFNVDPSPRDLAETYLPAFRRTVVEGKAASLMCAYNAVDGKPACASEMLLMDTLRHDWGFDGFVTSDCAALDDITNGHHLTATNVEGVALAVKAGTDTGCDFKDEMLDLPKAVRQGLISQGEVDQAVKRLFAARLRLGMFDPPAAVPFSRVPISANHAPANRTLALRAARESIVLLRNDGLLPLGEAYKRIAVVGPGATSLIALEGNYNGSPVGATLPLDSLAATYGAARVRYAQGAPFVEQVAVPVPRTVFGAGLEASYFKGTEFKGRPLVVRTEREIERNWNAVAPAPGVDPNAFSVRWTGTITPPAPGDYVLQVDVRRCDAKKDQESFTLRVEGAGESHIESACAESERHPLTVHFADTRPRSMSLDYVHRSPRYAPSFSLAWRPPVAALRDEAVRLAGDSDVVVAFLGLNAWLEGEEMPLKVPGFDSGDRTDIALPRAQADLLEALQASGKPVVVVLQSGSAMALGRAGEQSRAIVQAWYGGEQGGRAIADVLSGAVNPSGRLPVTFYRSVEQLPAFDDYRMGSRTYRYFEGRPEYPFGHGLSYTNFAYSDLSVGPTGAAASAGLDVSVRIRNTGKRAGDEVAQLYLSTPGRSGTPLRSLKGFRRIQLKPGEAQVARFHLDPRDLAFADAQGVMRIVPADYQLWVGGGQPGTGATGAASGFRLNETVALPR